MGENIKKEVKTVEVLVDLLGYGVVKLAVDYSLGFTGVLPRVCSIECHIDQSDQLRHSWLYSTDFKLIFSEIGQGKGHAVCFSGEGLSKNVYYQTMLNVVSDYIFLKEKFFCQELE
ncbi:hypothetical protein [Pedobacter miscanthi]|uniref:Uncharacterized protein n=1 Tax=Pedobacter miscanthi TaxID=2259170 RepID=A0A366LDT0_9SPHI|nr:hypothetical protein [Pedobacter miscanthi]RBQ11434.1 hypothetical protein DRW42_02935 [Pedobacter miscanthi]